MDISLAAGGDAEPQGQVVQGGGQLPGGGVGQGRAAGKPGQDTSTSCFLPDMLVVAAEGPVDVEQEDEVLGLLQMRLLAGTLEQLTGQQLRLVVM